MRKAKIKNSNKDKKVEIEKEEFSLKKMALVIIILMLIFVSFYFITTLVVKPVEETENISSTQIDSSKITLNHLLDRKEKEYYVLATKKSVYSSNKDVNYVEIYNKYINDYSKNDYALPIYIVELENALNKNFVGEELKITEDLNQLKLNDEVLFEIKDGKINKYYVSNSEIVKKLSSLQNKNH